MKHPSSRPMNEIDDEIRRIIESLIPKGNGYIVLYESVEGFDVCANMDSEEIGDILTRAAKQFGLMNNTSNN